MSEESGAHREGFIPSRFNVDDPLPGNRSPIQYAGMIQYMAVSHSSFMWARYMFDAARIIRHLSTERTEAEWRAKHGESVFATESMEEASRRVLRERAEVLTFKEPAKDGEISAQAPAPPAAAPPPPARAVLAKDGPASAPPQRATLTKPAEPKPVPTRATLKKPEAPTGGFFD